MFLRRADHSSRGVLPSVVCLNVIVKPRKGRPRPEYGPKSHKKVSSYFEYLENRSRGLDVTWQPVGGDLSVWSYDRASRSASFYSSHAGFFGKASHHPGLSAPLQPRFGSLRLLPFLKSKIAVEREEICEWDGHTVHKLSQRRLTADWLVRRESDCSRMDNKVSSDWMPSYIKATRPFLEICRMAGYFPDSPRKCFCQLKWTVKQYFLYSFFWAIPWRLNFMCRRFGTLSASSS